MNQFEYVLAKPADREAIIDFANYVFSQAHAPHDFKTLLPKFYSESVTEREYVYHFLARRTDGNIRGMVADYPLTLRILDAKLRAGFIGQVSSHPYARGEGHMKRLMNDLIDHARAQDMDLLILGGLRQRYNYFGFEQAGQALHFTVTSTNLRHRLGDVNADGVSFRELTGEMNDDFAFALRLVKSKPVLGERPDWLFMDIMHSWNLRPSIILFDDAPIGLIAGPCTELLLTDEAHLYIVLKALFARDKRKEVVLNVAPWETERIGILSELAESMTIHGVEMIRVLKWQPVLDAYLKLKASYAPLQDGCATLSIDGSAYTLRVENGCASVTTEDREPDLVLDSMGAQRLLFKPESALFNHPLLKNWLPLPFHVGAMDC